MERDVLDMCDVGRRRERPIVRARNISKRRRLGPRESKVIGVEEPRRLSPDVDTDTVTLTSCGNGVDIVLGEARIAALPRSSAVGADVERSTVRPGKEQTTFRLTHDRADVE